MFKPVSSTYPDLVNGAGAAREQFKTRPPKPFPVEPAIAKSVRYRRSPGVR